MKNFYKVFRLILLTVLITYFVGAIFYLISKLSSPTPVILAKVDQVGENVVVSDVLNDGTGAIPDAGADVSVGLVDGSTVPPDGGTAP